jgi:hypothetical protein
LHGVHGQVASGLLLQQLDPASGIAVCERQRRCVTFLLGSELNFSFDITLTYLNEAQKELDLSILLHVY